MGSLRVYPTTSVIQGTLPLFMGEVRRWEALFVKWSVPTALTITVYLMV